MALVRQSIEWAIEFVRQHSDGDLFPRIPEIEAIWEEKDAFISRVEGHPLTEFAPQASRRFIVPKDEIAYRPATQLHPQDSILLSAIVYQFGDGIESRRLGLDRVFSYRFSPSVTDGLYSGKHAWNEFWTAAYRESQGYSHVLYCDIADFYNQIYHHTVENQLVDAGFPNQAVKWLLSLFQSTTAGVSRGVPIGPHAVHLIAEATLIPVDNSMEANGIRFLRYADDIVIFCESIEAVRTALGRVASILDKQQRLMVQRHKVHFYEPAEFQRVCGQMIEDRPIDRDEEKLLGVLRKYTGGDPYKTISYNRIAPEDWAHFSGEVVRRIINDYLSREAVDYIRLRWFYRRLTQVGHPGALDTSIEQLDALRPCLANICAYIASIQSISSEEWEGVGERLLTLMDTSAIAESEYFRLSILSLFTRNSHIDHFMPLAARFQESDPYARREIILAAQINDARDWIREQKEAFLSMDPWQRSAFIYALSRLPHDERSTFLRRWEYDGPYSKTLVDWAKSKKART